MKHFTVALVFALVLTALGSQAMAAKPKAKPADVFAPIVDDPKLPRVLLIGDSISMGYTFPVRKMLAGKANVHRVPENGGDTARGLEKLDRWLGERPWDVIHFNFGLHDLKRVRNGRFDGRAPCVRSREEYAKNLDALVVRLKKTGATLIWATITPVPAGAQGRAKGDDVRYNAAAAEVMERHGVWVNDLYGYILPKLAEAQRSQDVHFLGKGSDMLGRRVAEAISAALAEQKKDAAAQEKP